MAGCGEGFVLSVAGSGIFNPKSCGLSLMVPEHAHPLSTTHIPVHHYTAGHSPHLLGSSVKLVCTSECPL